MTLAGGIEGISRNYLGQKVLIDIEIDWHRGMLRKFLPLRSEGARQDMHKCQLDRLILAD